MREILLIVIVGAVYLVAAKLGLKVAFVHPSATAVWPPTGIALPALLILGYRVWPAIFLGAFSANITTAGSLGTAVGIATGNTLEGLCGGYLINRFAGGRNVFQRPDNIFRYVVLPGMVSTLVSDKILGTARPQRDAVLDPELRRTLLERHRSQCHIDRHSRATLQEEDAVPKRELAGVRSTPLESREERIDVRRLRH